MYTFIPAGAVLAPAGCGRNLRFIVSAQIFVRVAVRQVLLQPVFFDDRWGKTGEA